MDVIETPEQIDEFLSHYKAQDEVYIDAVPANQTVHPRRSGVSFVFVRTQDREALFPVRHNDASTLNPKTLLRLNTDCRKYVFGKKRVLHLVPFKNAVDCKLLHYFRHNRPPVIDAPSVHPNAKNVYRPIMKLAERCQARADRCQEILNKGKAVTETRPFRKYNEEVLETLFRVERSGMFARREEFEKTFGKDLCDDSNLSYSKYNLYTQTGRPSNAYRGVNYAALDEGERNVFRSRFDGGKLINVDYDAFHLRIISSITGYDDPGGSFHEHLARLYFGDEEVGEEEYKEAKKFTFQFLYNPAGIPDELLQLDFFSGVKSLTKRIWDIYQEYGVISTAKHGRQITGANIENFNPAKALNYILQATGVEIVCSHLSKLLEYLSDKDTEVILYLYDSVLLDYNPSDDTDLGRVKEIMEGKKLTVNLEEGERFGEMEAISIDERKPTTQNES